MTLAPESLTNRLARRAVEIVQISGPRKTGRALNSIYPISEAGVVGIAVPDEAAYLFDLDQGIQSHAMVDLAGRVIPIRDSDGSIKFRRAGKSQIGQIPIITRLSKSGKVYTGKPQWVYPKKTGAYFLENAIKASVNEWSKTVTTKELFDLLLETDVKDEVADIFYKGRFV